MPAKTPTKARRASAAKPAPAPSPAQHDDPIAGLKALGAHAPGRTLAIGWTDPAACAAVKAAFKPTELTWIGPAPSPAPRSVNRVERVSDLPADAGFELAVLGPAFATGSLAQIRAALEAVAARLAPKATVLMAIDTFAASGDPAAPMDAVLFPALAAGGALGEGACTRPALGASAWLLMLNAVGLKPEAVSGYGEAPPSAQDMADHGPRLALVDERELATPRLLVRAVRQGPAR